MSKPVLAVGSAALMVMALVVSGCGGGGGTPGTSPATTPHTVPATTPIGGQTMSVFFMKGDTVSQVTRHGAPEARAALNALLAGPTEGEKAQGYSSAIPAGTRLLSYVVSGDGATADFSKEMLAFGGGSAIVQAIMSQIDNTVLNNDKAVSKVSITIEGRPSEEVLQP